MRLNDWNIMPTRRARYEAGSRRESESRGAPRNSIVPAVGVSSPARRLRRVDLPDPDAPITAKNSPSSIPISTPSTARTSWGPRR